MELGSVVGRDGVRGARGRSDQANRPTVGGFDGASLELSDHHVAGLTIDEREYAVFVGAADDRITFEVADLTAVLCRSRTLRDQPLAREPAPIVIAAVAFPSLFR